MPILTTLKYLVKSATTSVLYFTVQFNMPLLVKAAIFFGADANYKDEYGTPLLHFAKSAATAKVLIEYGKADADAVDSHGNTLLHTICIRLNSQSQDLFAYLLKTINNLNVLNTAQETPLMLAACNGNITALQAFTNAGININTPINSIGDTVAHFIVRKLSGNSYSHFSSDSMKLRIQPLKDVGADFNTRNAAGDTPLQIAVSQFNHKIIPVLQDAGVEIDVLNKDGMTCLQEICSNQNHKEEMVAALIKAETDLTVRYSDGSTLLHSVIKERMHGYVPLLINAGIDLDVFDNENCTALYLAAYPAWYDDIVKLLIEAKANVNLKNGAEGFTILHIATLQSERLVKLIAFIQSKGNINVTDNKGKTALHFAAERDLSDSVSALLSFHADATLKDHNDKTAMQLALRRGYKAVKAFMSAGVNLNDPTDDNNNTLLHLECQNDDYDLEMLQLLIAHGAALEVQDRKLNTPLHIACARQGTANVVKILLNAKANVNASNKDGETPLHIACKARRYHATLRYDDHSISWKERDRDLYGIFEALISSGADFFAQDKNGRTPLHYAAQFNCYELVSLIPSSMKDCLLDARDFDKFTALQEAVISGNVEMIIALTNAGADINVKDKDQNTLMHLAVINNKPNVVDALATMHSQINTLNALGNTPLATACMLGQHSMVGPLILAGANTKFKNKQGESLLNIALKYENFQAAIATYKALIDADGHLRINATVGLQIAILRKDKVEIDMLITAGVSFINNEDDLNYETVFKGKQPRQKLTPTYALELAKIRSFYGRVIATTISKSCSKTIGRPLTYPVIAHTLTFLWGNALNDSLQNVGSAETEYRRDLKTFMSDREIDIMMNRNKISVSKKNVIQNILLFQSLHDERALIQEPLKVLERSYYNGFSTAELNELIANVRNNIDAHYAKYPKDPQIPMFKSRLQVCEEKISRNSDTRQTHNHLHSLRDSS